MKKSTLNFIINAILFLAMAAITGIGFLIKYVLIPGSERWDKYGENVDLSVWGMDRHEWAYIHLIIGFVILSLVLLHIVLHWNMVINVYHRLFKKKAIYRILSIAFIFIGILMMLVPFFMEAQISEHHYGGGRKEKQEQSRKIENHKKQDDHQEESLENKTINKTVKKKESKKKEQQELHQNKNNHAHDSSLGIRGYMTLNEISTKYHISTDIIKSELGIPKTSSNNERLGKLKKAYDFKISDIEKIIHKHQKGNA